MAITKQHRILIAFDGSPPAQAALATVAKFPWPASSRVSVVVSRFPWMPPDSTHARAVFKKSFDTVAAAARRALVRRWPNAKVVLMDIPPVDAIRSEAERFKATLIVLGWRGHGTFRRLLVGSVSRSVAAHAKCPVLVVPAAAKAMRRFVVGFDGSLNAERAVEFLRSLEPGRGGWVMLVNVVEPVSAPRFLGPASLRANVHHEVAAINEGRYQQGQAAVAAAVAQLERSGWTAEREVRVGDPLASLLNATEMHRADLLVVGARATSWLERALVGSVANGALDRSPVPVLLVS